MDKEKYKVDISSFSKERPLGISGILRVKNDAEFLDTCIESCIDALDELIIVYNGCTDNSTCIIAQKAKKYSSKIQSFEYEPYIFYNYLENDTFRSALKLPADSIHLFSTYSNYALSKVTYQYALIIDSDQIYFTEKLKKICNAYRNTAKQKINWMEKKANQFFNDLQKKKKTNTIWRHLLIRITSNYRTSYIIKEVINNKSLLSLSGINVFYKENWYVSLGGKDGQLIDGTMFPPFNGTHDHCIFKVSAETYYKPWFRAENPDNKRIIEILSGKGAIIDIGFFWFHLHANRKNKYKNNIDFFKKNSERFLSVQLFKDCHSEKLRTKYNAYFHSPFFEFLFCYFHDTQKNDIPWNMLSQFPVEKFTQTD